MGPGSFQPTRERVEPQWNLPWQGNADFVTDIPGRQQSDLGAPAFNMETIYDQATPPGTTDQFINNQWVPQEEIPQTQRPARQTNKWPWGQSISNMFRGAMNQIIPPAY